MYVDPGILMPCDSTNAIEWVLFDMPVSCYIHCNGLLRLFAFENVTETLDIYCIGLFPWT